MVTIRGTSDGCLQAIAGALGEYSKHHPDSEIVVYRQNSVSVRVRIVDPDFNGMHKSDRHDLVWDLVKKLPEDQQSELSVLLLLTPGELDASFANSDFENPVPSQL